MEVRVILVEPEHDGNVGSIARIAKNFGVKELWIVNPKAEIGSESRVYAVHARNLIDEAAIVKNLEEACHDASFIVGSTAIVAKKTSNVLRMPITPEELGVQAAQIKGKIALLLGRESKGLSNNELDICDVIVTIPTSHLYRTLNIASASAIILYELWKAKAKSPRGYFEEAGQEEKARLLGFFDEISMQSYLPAYKRKLATKAFHNVISRAFISKREATLMMGALRRTLRNEKAN
jgi:tRNA/rRNA methyltransferase